MNDAQSQSPVSVDTVTQQPRGKFNFWRWFWLSTLFVSLPWVWYDFYVPSNRISWAKDYSSAQQHSAQSGKPMILFFTATWCVPCRIMKRNVWADKQVEASVEAGVTPVMIDMDDPKEAETVRRFGVGSTPVTIIIDTKGNVVERAEGGIGKSTFLELLGKATSPASPLPL